MFRAAAGEVPGERSPARGRTPCTPRTSTRPPPVRRIVNLERVVELQPGFGGNYTLKLSTGVELVLSRGYRQRMQETIATYT